MVVEVMEMYTIGQFSKKTGLTIRALRFYDEKGLLKPASTTEGGQRLYNNENLVVAQKIATYKYLDFSLQEMKDLLQEEVPLLTSLEQQRSLLVEKQKQLKKIIASIDTAITIQKKLEVTEPTLLILVMHSLLTLNEQRNYLKQYLSEAFIDELFSYFEAGFVDLNRQYIELSYEIKNAYTKRVDDVQLTTLLTAYLNLIPKEFQMKIACAFADAQVEQLDDWLFPSPFTPEEEVWVAEQLERLNILGDDFFEESAT